MEVSIYSVQNAEAETEAVGFRSSRRQLSALQTWRLKRSAGLGELSAGRARERHSRREDDVGNNILRAVEWETMYNAACFAGE